ncbi:TrbI/VirB10 family protein [Sandaracinobacter neustonicus]|uniref:TrbI/VirB10 family protein n=1 Tax=Sandaracinobacter neustonicus TaxID=1715348 RepID=A0A501XNQ3_9SPHN|nr:TrbI/VirB10 family protein [Sandaracinobacter neustonicus]TPE61934.1 TrbI/VirB10 family protein [Sandaracinobacter neustonicus]
MSDDPPPADAPRAAAPDVASSAGVPTERPRLKEAADAMRLRPALPPVTRLSRKALLAIGVAVSIGVGGALIYALKGREAAERPAELLPTDNRSTADGLAQLPRDYSGIPRLGPPLPGDLGRPILRAQQQGKDVPVPGINAPSSGSQPVNPEVQQRQLERETARTARLFAAGNITAAPEAASAAMDELPAEVGQQAGSAQTGTTVDPREAFLNRRAAPTTSAERITAPSSRQVLQAGAIIPIALLTGIRSDLPGQVTAQVTSNVYDSPTGRIVLIPQGTRVVGDYDSGVTFGQRRVLLAWNRLILPDGRSLALDRQPGTDAQGQAGMQDGVDRHWGQMLRASLLSTILGIGTELGSGSDDSDLVRALRRGAADSVTDIGRQIVGRQLDVAPTLTIQPGFTARILVTRDLVLEPYGEGR